VYVVVLVALTKTTKRSTKDHKSAYVQQVRTAIDNHERLFLFSYENMRSNKFKDIRMHFRSNGKTSSNIKDMEEEEEDDDDDDNKNNTNTDVPSRIFLGKNKLLQIALGKTPEDEYADNLRHVSKEISDSVGLLVTSQSKKEVKEFFSNWVEPDFARAGFTSPKDVMVTNDMLAAHPVSMVEQQFRKQGLPVKIHNGKIVLLDGKQEHRLCKEGEVLSPEKCKTLTHFGIKLSEFRVRLVCHWSKDGGFDKLT
jgi:mRNA turnover protein 4